MVTVPKFQEGQVLRPGEYCLESMSTYSPFSVSLLITRMLWSSGRDESIPDMEPGDMDSSDMREKYVFSYS